MAGDREYLELGKLIIELVDGSINNERLALLDKWLHQSPEALNFYREFMKNIVVLNRRADIYLNGSEEDSSYAFLEYLAEYEKTAPMVEVLEEKPTAPIREIHQQRPIYTLKRSSLYTIYSAIAAILLIVLFVRFAPSKGGVEVATLTDSINAKWAEIMMQDGERLKTDGSTLMLREGYAELLFDNQAKVTIEGPAEFQIHTEDQIKFIYGRLYATVPREAIGFTVKTPSAQIVDLGTEFGVDIDFQGDTSLHVMKGKTVLIAGDKSNKVSVEVGKGTAKKVSGHTQTISDISCNDRLFAREISSASQIVWRGQTEVDLADIVGGGNGFGTGKLDSGIETNTGQPFASPDPELVLSKVSGIITGDGAYNTVSSLPFVDGVFVPDSRQGPVQITSAGHRFDGFVYGREVFWGNIFNGAWHASDTSLKHDLKLNGQTYGTNENPAISLHSSQGITFDLQAIRQTIPGGRILRFTSLFGVSETVALDPSFTPKKDGSNSGKVNCWVLVDGKERFNRDSVAYLQGVLEIDVDLNDDDRFLTLVVTESDDRRAYDWALFAKPSLLIEKDIN